MSPLMLSTLTITDAHEKLRTKKISATELVQSCLDRIAEVDPKIHAVVYNNGEEALKKAKEIDRKGDFSHPLTGIPYLTKDVYCEKGVPTTGCSNILRGLPTEASAKVGKTYRPPYDSTTTKRLNAVGAISLGKSNTDEFTMGASTETSCYGPTRNPWDVSRVAGGSSGGSAAGVASGECIFALGTDTGGSIRQPAGFCGCTGLRVTYGRTSRYGVMSMASSLDTIGPLGRTIEDLAIVLEPIAGHDEHDATTPNAPVPKYRESLGKPIKGMKIGLPKEYFIPGMDGEVEGAVREAAKVLEKLGAKVKQLSLPHTKYAVATYYIIVPSEVSSNMARYDGIRFGHSVSNAKDLTDYYERVRSEGFGAEVKRRIMIGTYALSAGYADQYYWKAMKVRALIKRDFDEAFKDIDVILSPVSPTPAFTVGAHADDPIAMYLEDIFMCAQPMAGIPGLSLPCGFSSKGLPIGLQIMGPQFGEETILKVGHAYEQATEWHRRKPRL